MESQLPILRGYLQSITGYFRVWWPVTCGYLAFQVAHNSMLLSFDLGLLGSNPASDFALLFIQMGSGFRYLQGLCSV